MQGEVERRSTRYFTLCPDAATMPAYDPLHRGETDARSLELGRRVQPLEDPEELRRKGHVEASAVVAHEVHRLPVLLRGAELDAALGLVARELPRVPEEVVEHHPEEATVPFCLQVGRDRDLHAPLRLEPLEPLGGGAAQC